MNTRRTIAVLAAALMGAGVLGACAPKPAPNPPVNGGTTTTAVEFSCAGTGIIGPGGASPVGPIADQTTNVAITLPTSATVGETFNVGVDVGNLNLAAAPGFINLNSAGIVATVTMSGTNGNATVAANNFVGNGASIDLNQAVTTATAVAGANTVTATAVAIQSGSTGFLCTPTGAGASGSLTV